MTRFRLKMGRRGLSRVLLATSVLFGLSAVLLGCGFIADPDMRKVAEMDGEVINAGDLMRVIRNMEDDERPLIQNKSDLRRALDTYIDNKIRDEIAEALLEEGRIQPNTALATSIYFEENPEYELLWHPNADVEALARNLNYGKAEIDVLMYAIELGIEAEEYILLREQGLDYVRNVALSQGTLSVTEDEYDADYAMRKDELISFESIDFRAIRFPAALDDASGQAHRVIQRIRAGEPFGDIFKHYKSKDAASVIEAAFENDPAAEKFKLFWGRMTGSKVGDIIGPIFLPPYTDILEGRALSMPGAFLVLEVVAREDRRQKSAQEARDDMATGILSQKMMQRLREEHGVAIFPEGLPDPAGFGDQYKGIFIPVGNKGGRPN